MARSQTERMFLRQKSIHNKKNKKNLESSLRSLKRNPMKKLKLWMVKYDMTTKQKQTCSTEAKASLFSGCFKNVLYRSLEFKTQQSRIRKVTEICKEMP